VRDERVGQDRASQVRFQVEQPDRVCAHRLVEQRAAVAALGLGAVHRGIGVAQHFVAQPVARLPQRDADARRREQFATAQPQRLGQPFQDPRRQRLAV